jgi:hypothetical protein
VQLLVRAIRGIPSTQLEVITISYAACSFVTYVLNFKKPKDAKRPIYILAERYPTSQEMLNIASYRFRRIFKWNWIGPLIARTPLSWLHDQTPWLANDSHCRNRGFNFYTGVGLGSMILGGIHCAAWNSEFPIPVERLLWRISSVTTAAIPVVIMAVQFSSLFLHRRGFHTWYFTMIILFLMFLYIGARLCVLVESLRTIAFQPVGAFISTWTSSIPHLG